jgi:hypothetical protein
VGHQHQQEKHDMSLIHGPVCGETVMVIRLKEEKVSSQFQGPAAANELNFLQIDNYF